MIWILAACAPPSVPPPTGPTLPDQPIVVFFTTDTLGMAAAKASDWCGHLNSVLGAHGRDVACLEGGVSPSSWTGEAHTRLLWPSHLLGTKRAAIQPECGEASVHGTLAASLGAFSVWGADNEVLSNEGTTCQGRSSWFQDSDVAYGTRELGTGLAGTPEEERPVGMAISDILAASAAGGPVVAFLNAFEVGGHFPRCFFDPTTPSCDAMWHVAVNAGLAKPFDDRQEAWLNHHFVGKFMDLTANHLPDSEDELRPMFWGSMLEAIDHHRGPRFDDRLERLLEGLDTQGRTGDLVLIALADHGETPCARRPVGDQHFSCAHGGLANEFSANVPVFVSPAWLADQWRDQGYIGDATTPWTTASLAWATLDASGVPAPSTWPYDGPEPPGAAMVWTCDHQTEETNTGPAGAGVRIVGDASVRCQADDCIGMSWHIPDGPLYKADVLDPIPPEISDYDSDWAVQACAR